MARNYHHELSNSKVPVLGEKEHSLRELLHWKNEKSHSDFNTVNQFVVQKQQCNFQSS